MFRSILIALTISGALWAQSAVSLEQFGAVGDGTTDDTAAMENAISSGATTIILGPGCRYDMNHEEVVLRSDIEIVGNNAVLVDARLNFNESSNVRMRDITFEKTDGANIGAYNYQGIGVSGTNHTLERIRFTTSGTGSANTACLMGGARDVVLRDFYFGPNAGSASVYMRGERIAIDRWTMENAQDDDAIALKAFESDGCRDITISNINAKGASAIISLGSQSAPASPMENITITNLVGDNCARAIYIKNGYAGVNNPALMGGYWRNIAISNVTLETRDVAVDHPLDSAIEIALRKDAVIDGLTIDNVNVRGNTESAPPRQSCGVRFAFFRYGGGSPKLINTRISNVSIVSGTLARDINAGVLTEFNDLSATAWDASVESFPSAATTLGDSYTVTGLSRSNATLHDGDVVYAAVNSPSDISDFTIVEIEDQDFDDINTQQYFGEWSGTTYPQASDKVINAAGTIYQGTVKAGDQWVFAADITIGMVDYDAGDLLEADIDSPDSLGDFTITDVEDRPLLDFERDVDIRNLTVDDIEAFFVNEKRGQGLRLIDCVHRNPIGDGTATNYRPSIRFGTNMPELVDFRIRGDFTPRYNGVDWPSHMINPLSTESARTYAGPKLQMPGWVKFKEFTESEYIRAWGRVYIPRVEVSAPTSPGATTITVEKNSVRYGGTHPIITWSTDTRPIPAGSSNGWHVMYDETFTSANGENSYLEPGDTLTLDSDPDVPGIVYRVYYVEF